VSEPAHDGYRVLDLSAADALLRRTELCEVYGRAFAEPPWREADAAYRCMEQLPRHLEWPGWRARGLVRSDGSVAGFAYGAVPAFPFPALAAYRRVEGLLGDQVAELAGEFEVIEIAVAPADHGMGLGGRLLGSLTTGLEQGAWLLTIHGARGAIRTYERLGWRLEAAEPESVRKGLRLYRRPS
jgi:ribosomal protein S18 acetylase RimI-like enzyme